MARSYTASITHEFEEVFVKIEGRDVWVTGELEVDYHYDPDEGVSMERAGAILITNYTDVETEQAVAGLFTLDQSLKCADLIMDMISEAIVEECVADARDEHRYNGFGGRY